MREEKRQRAEEVPKERSERRPDYLRGVAAVGLLGRVWPADRVLLGTRVCRWLKEQLIDSVEEVKLVGRSLGSGVAGGGQGRGGQVHASDVSRSLIRLKGKRVALHWQVLPVSAVNVFLDGMSMAIRSGFGRQLTHLHLGCSSGLGGNEGKGLSEAFQSLPQLEHLDLNSCGLGAAAASLMLALGNCRLLRYLDLGANGFEDMGAVELASRLGGWKDLAHLDLSDNLISQMGARELGTKLGSCKQLMVLNLNDNSLGIGGAGLLAPGLQGCSALVHLVGSYHEHEKTHSSLGADAVLLCCQGLSETEMDDEGMTSLSSAVSECKLLQRLDAGGNDELGPEGARRLADALMHCPFLTQLDLGETSLGDAGVESVAAVLGGCCPLLKGLNLSETGTGDAGARRLALALQECTALTELTLNRNRIGMLGAAELTKGLGRCGALRRLEMKAMGYGAGDEAVGALARALGACKELRDVDLSMNGVGDEGAGRVAVALREWKHVCSFSMKSNVIGARGAGRISEALRECAALVRLDLAENELGDEGVVRLAAVLPSLTSLEFLDLASNEIGDEGAESLSAALGDTGRLQHLILRDNAIGDEGAAFLAAGLRRCRGLRLVDLVANRFRAPLVKTLREVAGDVVWTGKEIQGVHYES